MGSANTIQNRFRWRNDDGSESAATWKALVNTNWTPTIDDMDVPIRLRIEMSNTGGMDENDANYYVYMDKDGGGYNLLSLAGTYGAQLVASAYVTDDTTTTEQMAGSQTHQAGKFDSNASIAPITLTGSSDMEMEYCLKLDSANLVGGEVLSFRVYRNTTGTTFDGYTNTPTITVPTLPSAEWTQAEFRIRPGGILGDSQALNANSAGDWAEAADTNATLDSWPTTLGCTPRIRWKVSCGNQAGTVTPKIQYRLNGGSWADLPWDDHTDQLNLTAHRPIGCYNSYRFTDGDATTQLLSGSSFVAGSGEDSSNTAAGVALTVGDHTEFEWPIFINKLWDGTTVGHVDGDYYEFRLVESDGTAFTTYTVTPRITLNYDNDYIGGCYPESVNDYGIFESSGGDQYTILEDSEKNGNLKCVKRASGTTRWVVVDQTNEPSAFKDMEACHIYQDGDMLYGFHQGGTTYYYTFNMSTDAWGTEELIESVGGSINTSIIGYRRSDGTTLAVYLDGSDNVVYKERSSGGVWDASNTTVRTGTAHGLSGVIAESDKIYLSWKESSNTIYSQSIDSTNTLGTLRTISTDGRSSGSGSQSATIKPVYWDSSGVEKVGIIYQRETDAKLYWRIISDDGAPATEAAVTPVACLDNAYGLNSRQPAAMAHADGTTIYVGYVTSADQDVYYITSDDGAAFGSATEVWDAVTIQTAAMQIVGSELIFLSEEYHKDSSTQASGYTGSMMRTAYTVADTTDELTATGITTTPVVATPTIGQTHVLAAVGITTTPVVATPTIGQTHVLAATAISTTPVVATPTLAESHVLTATGITTTPVAATPTIGQTHILASVAIATTPVAATPTIGQIHVLDAVDISTTPVAATPTIGQTHPLVSVAISTTPVVATSDIGQVHVLDAVDISTTPVVATSDIGQVHVLDAVDISTTPVVETPTLGSSGEDNLTANGITTTPVAETPSLGQEHNLTSVGITTTPIADTPTIGSSGEDNLTANGITTTPVVATPTLGQEHALVAIGITTTPVVATPDLTQIHSLSPVDITTTPVVETPTVANIHNLVAIGVTTTPVVETTSLGQVHVLDAVDISTTPVLATPSMTGEHELTANGITTTPVLETPDLGQEHALTAVDISTTPVLESSSIGQTHVLDSVAISTTPVLGTPSMGGEHDLIATGITTTPVLENSEIGQIHILDSIGLLTTPVVESSDLAQIHALDAIGISTTPVLGTPSMTGESVLIAIGITTTPIADTPSVGQIHIFASVGITSTPVVTDPTIGQTHSLSSVGIESTPVFEDPTLSHIHVLEASDLLATVVLASPLIGQVHQLSASELLVTPILDAPAFGQTHILDSSGITTTPTVGMPSWDLISGVVDIRFGVVYLEVDFDVIYPEVRFETIDQ